MNILFLDSIATKTYGGMEEWIKLVAHGLADRGHHVTVAGRPKSVFLQRVSSFDNRINIVPLDISGDFNPRTIAQLKSFISENNIDLITVNFNKDVRIGGIAARLDGRPAVIWSVGLDITKDSFVHRHFTPRLVDGVLVPSVSLKRQITRLGYIREDMVAVIPIGIPQCDSHLDKTQAKKILQKKYHLPQDAHIAVTVGRFVEQKGHTYLIQAAKKIIADYPTMRFLLLGNGPLEQKIADAIQRASLEEYFIFTGMLSDFDEELAGADMMIHPSVEEPFGIAILEGMRAGLPVVASRVGGIPEVVEEGETAMLVPPGSGEELARAVQEMLASETKRHNMGTAGQKRWSELFRLETMIAQVERYFLTCLTTAKLIDE